MSLNKLIANNRCNKGAHSCKPTRYRADSHASIVIILWAYVELSMAQ
jgi:hypothetical protein